MVFIVILFFIIFAVITFMMIPKFEKIGEYIQKKVQLSSENKEEKE